MRNKLTIWLFIAAVFVLPLSVYAVINWYKNNFQRLPVLGRAITVNGKKVQHTITSFSLTDQEGKILNEESWNGKIVIADFFFTRCPSICPKMTRSLLQVQKAFQNDPAILINSFTVDPEHDDAPVLKKYADHFGIDVKNWNLLTGNKMKLYQLARNSFLISAGEGDGGPADFIHSDRLVLVDKSRRIRGYYDGTSAQEVDQLIHDIKKLKDEN